MIIMSRFYRPPHHHQQATPPRFTRPRTRFTGETPLHPPPARSAGFVHENGVLAQILGSVAISGVTPG